MMKKPAELSSHHWPFFVYFAVSLLLFLLAGCNGLADKITASQTPTIASTYTSTATTTLSPTLTDTPTPRPTSTPRPTATLVPGAFNNPLGIGDSITLPMIPREYRKPGTKGLGEMECTLLDVRTGEEAKQLAKQELDWIVYDEPIEGQEYLAVRARLKLNWYDDNNQVETIYPDWSLSLRYEKDGEDTYSVDIVAKFAEGYPPIEGEGWVFYLIRSDSKPYLYFQPDLQVFEQAGIRTSGAYYDIFGLNQRNPTFH